jgi:hypothetical protein
VEGCDCEEGYLRSIDGCVKVEECPPAKRERKLKIFFFGKLGKFHAFLS